MKQIINNTVFVIAALITMILWFAALFSTMIYGVFSVHLLDVNGYQGLALGIGFVTILMMLLETYFFHRVASWAQETF